MIYRRHSNVDLEDIFYGTFEHKIPNTNEYEFRDVENYFETPVNGPNRIIIFDTNLIFDSDNYTFRML